MKDEKIEELKIHGGLYVLAGLSFIPLLGVVFGLISIILGFVLKRQNAKRLAMIGAGGILCTIALYGSLFYFGFVQRGGVYDELRQKLAQGNLNDVVKSIEFYKLQHGYYPRSLEDLRKATPENSFLFINDPTDIKIGGEPRLFYYQLEGSEHYYLLSVGADATPFTQDDIVPVLDGNAPLKGGLLVKKKRP